MMIGCAYQNGYEMQVFVSFITWIMVIIELVMTHLDYMWLQDYSGLDEPETYQEFSDRQVQFYHHSVIILLRLYTALVCTWRALAILLDKKARNL